MTAERPRLLDLRHVSETRAPFADGATATVADDAGAVRVTVSRSAGTTPASAEAPLTVVAIEGEIDEDTAPLVRLVLARALESRAAVCCDLSGVTFFGAAAANTALVAHHRASALGQVFFLRGVRGITGRVLAIVDPDRVVPR